MKYGHEAFRSGYELLGGLAEHCLLVPGTTIVRVPDELSLKTVSPASCATATIAAALEAAGTLQDRVICITGAGLLGLDCQRDGTRAGCGSGDRLRSECRTTRARRRIRSDSLRRSSMNWEAC